LGDHVVFVVRIVGGSGAHCTPRGSNYS
jgi:hypothetical protein